MSWLMSSSATPCAPRFSSKVWKNRWKSSPEAGLTICAVTRLSHSAHAFSNRLFAWRKRACRRLTPDNPGRLPSVTYARSEPGMLRLAPYPPKLLTARWIAGPAFFRSSATMAGVASMRAFNARNHGSAISGSCETSSIFTIRIAVRIPPSATK